MKVTFKNNDEEKVIDLEDCEFCKDANIEIDDDESCVNIHRKKKFSGKIVAVTPILCTLIYLFCGFVFQIWHPTWVIFLLIPIVPIICDVFTKRGRGQVISLITVLVIIGYFVLGIYGYWHPGWLIFFLIPIFSILISK